MADEEAKEEAPAPAPAPKKKAAAKKPAGEFAGVSADYIQPNSPTRQPSPKS